MLKTKEEIFSLRKTFTSRTTVKKSILFNEAQFDKITMTEYKLMLKSLHQQDFYVYNYLFDLKASLNSASFYSVIKALFLTMGKRKVIVNGEKINLYDKLDYDKGHCSIRLNPILLKPPFFHLPISRCFDLKYVSSIRLYELLYQYMKFGKRELSILDFQEKCGIVDSQNRTFVNRYMYKAIEDINANTNIEITDFERIKYKAHLIGLGYKFKKTKV